MQHASKRPVALTKIIATLGPVSSSREALTRLFDAGVDVCRLNFSHGDLDTHGRTLGLVRTLATERDQPVCVIGDLCGPKIRLGDFPAGPVTLRAGEHVQFVHGTGPCDATRFTISYPGFADEVEPGNRILIDDGLVRLVARQRRVGELDCEVVIGGEVKSHKGVNLPDTQLSTPSLTDKDRVDAAWAIEHGLDYLALSFVRTPEDLYELKRFIKSLKSDMPVIIKVEKTEALEHLNELVEQTDAVLVARGDLGVETDVWRVPVIQKDLVARCRRVGTPVIVATQMLQSMVDSPMPTRAEVSDVANAVFDQADAVMLSGETAVGKYPVEAVRMMGDVARSAAEFLAWRHAAEPKSDAVSPFRSMSAVAHAAVQAAQDLGARLVAVWTATGATVRRVAQHRLPVPIVGLTNDPAVARRLNLLFGVVPLCVEPTSNPADMSTTLSKVLVERGLATVGELIVVVTSTQPMRSGMTDTVMVHRVGADRATTVSWPAI